MALPIWWQLPFQNVGGISIYLVAFDMISAINWWQLSWDICLSANKRRTHVSQSKPLHFRLCLASPGGFEPLTPRLGELCGSVNPCQELICLAFYYQGLFLFSNQIMVIWIPFLSRPDKTWKLADSLQLLTSGESSVVTDRYHLPATIPLQAGMINNIQLTRFLLLLYTVIENLSMVFRPRQPT